MEISTKKLATIVIAVSFITSSIGGFAFGILGSMSGSKVFPKIAGDLVKNLENIDKNILSSSPDASLTGNIAAISGSDQGSVVNAIKKANPAVVSIIVTKDLPTVKRYNPFDDSFFNQFFGQDYSAPQDNSPSTQKKETGRGSGFIVSSDGYIVTNKHVANDKKAEYTVLMNDGKEYPAKLLAADPVNDLAVIKVDQKDLPTVALGDSGSLEVGQTAIAIGNALGEFRNTASLGIISGLGRSITASGTGFGSEQLTNIIQTDAAINPGNSGGPLLDLAGNVVGVNVAVAQGAQSIGFAIPINDVKKVINDVKTTGRVITPWLGIRYVLITKDVKDKNNLSVDYGALIARGDTMSDLAVIPGSPADKAGIAENDIVLEIDGIKIDAQNSLQSLVGKHSVGDEITLKVLHKGAEKQIKVKLEEKKAQ